MTAFFFWLCDAEKRGDWWLFWPLVVCLGYRALGWVVEWVYYAHPKFEPILAPKRDWTVDVLTTACPGEPHGMIIRTLLAMKAIRYPHRDYLCDEGNDPVLREVCEALDITHVTRAVKTDAKAGNINNALTQCRGEIAVVLDPDHEPSPYLLDRVLGYFGDPTVGFVQSVQAYRNQNDSLVADGAAKQTYLFYGPMMMGMHQFGTTQAIGANCVFRRAALDSIGGHAAGLAEDMHTTMRLYAKGWRSVYVPEILTRGLVPSTLSAYCKQQLKWACGAMELMLWTYPGLFKGMTWSQRLHYFLGPLYFLRGIFGLVNIVVPIVCLAFGGVALRINLPDYLAMYLPALLIVAAVRQKTQRWVIEPAERGAHLMGGILLSGCWWEFLRGSLCAFCRVKLPYIPTPKDNEAHDCWRLAIPNLIAAGLSIAAVIYGLIMDWTPFNLMMAAFALWNAAQLTFVAALGQQRTLQRLAYAFCRRDWIDRLYERFSRFHWRLHSGMVNFVRERSRPVAATVIGAAVVFNPWARAPVLEETLDRAKEAGGFYIGLELPEADQGIFPATFTQQAAELDTRFRLFPFRQKWGPESLAHFPYDAMRKARLSGAVPMITWEPQSSTFPELRNDPDLSRDRRVFAAVLRGRFDEYLLRYAERIRDFGDPVLIRFAPLADQPTSPWSSAGRNTAREFVDAWDYIVAAFNSAGATNVGWVWQPSSADAFETHFPNSANVDWVGVSVRDANSATDESREFAGFYAPFHEKLKTGRMPVMLTDLDPTADNGNRTAWCSRALTDVASKFPEIHGLVLSGAKNGSYAEQSAAVTDSLARSLALPPLRALPRAPVEISEGLWVERKRDAVRSTAIRGEAGAFSLMVDGQPFYIQGVAYNRSREWRDGYAPLTRRELLADFAQIRSVGANTIRRYGTGWYDRNILAAADEQGLKVLCGFWFEHHVDYRTDASKLNEYRTQVEKTVRARRNQSSVLAWSLGNEVWGLLKHHYAQPYLTEVRHAHIDFVESLARRVHELDPQHPVFVAHEHSPQLPGALCDFVRGAPSVDFTGVNSYYEQRISTLARIAARFDPGRPYFISEFGPDGYWESNGTPRDPSGALLEPPSAQKTRSFERGWKNHTAAHRGANVGGVAYCWRNRCEATATWFGLTDGHGRPKQECLALQRLWTGGGVREGPQILALNGPEGPLQAGDKVVLHADVRGASGTALNYQWRLATENFHFKTGALESASDKAFAHFTLPRTPGSYRVYLNVSDGHTADEANFPIHVTEGPRTQRVTLADVSDIIRAVPEN
ncbi:MAG TPA: glycosyltransferase [Chthoniobacteraceae bacterium]|nr:glycosyltransferase [Chthoniobacteraceae bacterium]